MIRLEACWGFLVSGGPVMIPLAMLSMWMWLLIFKEWLSLKRFRMPFDLDGALACLDQGGAPGSEEDGHPRVKALGWFLSHRTGGHTDRLLWEAAMGRLMSRLGRRTGTVMMLAMTAPLLGLLGTVTGMVETFEVIGWYGLGNIQALAAGIEEALITTQTGLLIAIAGLFGGRALGKQVRRTRQDLLVFHRAVERRLNGGSGHA